jgi:hypothetical protein
VLTPYEFHTFYAIWKGGGFMGWAESFGPSHFADLQPHDPNGQSEENKSWTKDPKFGLLAKVFGGILTDSASKALGIKMDLPAKIPEYATNRDIPPIGRSGLVLSANSATTGSGVFTPKRYVRLSPYAYHANACQLFIEAYMSGAERDRNSRDASDSQFKQYGFPVGVNHIGITIGFSAILHSEKFDFTSPSDDEKWTMAAAVLDGDKSSFDLVCEEFDDMAEVVANVAEKMKPEAPAILDGRVARVRIRLPDQSLDSHDWSECGLIEKMEQLAEIVFPALPHN